MPQSFSCELPLYADDSCLVFTDKNFENIENNLNVDIDPYVTSLLTISSVFTLGEDQIKSILFGTKRKLRGLKKTVN